MEGNKNKRKIKRLCFALIWGMIHMVSLGIAVEGNKTFAANMPFITFQETQKENSTKIKESISDVLFKFVDFIKTKVSKNNPKHTSSSNITIDNSYVEEKFLPKEYFLDVLYNKDNIPSSLRSR